MSPIKLWPRGGGMTDTRYPLGAPAWLRGDEYTTTGEPGERAVGRVYLEAATGDGYLHREDDDGPYYVDGLEYCGRCHRYIDSPALGDSE